MTIDNHSLPFSAVALVTMQLPVTVGANAGTTLSLIEGAGVFIAPDEVLVSSSQLFNQDRNLTAGPTSITVLPAVQGTDIPFGGIAATNWHFFQVNDAGGDIQPASVSYDFALIHLSQSVTGAGFMTLTPNFAGGTVHQTGYTFSSSGLATMGDTTFSMTANPDLAIFQYPFGAAASKGPIWTTDSSGKPLLVSLVSTIDDSPIFTTENYNQIQSWIAQDHAASGSPTGGSIAALPAPRSHAIANASDGATMLGSLAGDSLTGSGNSQWLVAGNGAETLTASGSNASLFGGAGNDLLIGGSGDSYLLAGSGATTLQGSGHNDVEQGGTGADTFVFKPGATRLFDVVIGYNAAKGDQIHITATPGSPIADGATAAVFQLSDGANTFVFLGHQAGGNDNWLVLFGIPHVSASDLMFV